MNTFLELKTPDILSLKTELNKLAEENKDLKQHVQNLEEGMEDNLITAVMELNEEGYNRKKKIDELREMDYNLKSQFDYLEESMKKKLESLEDDVREFKIKGIGNNFQIKF